MATKSEKDLYARLARIGCILCRCNGIREIEDSPVEMHHVRRFGGKRSNSPVIPLCAYHHRLGHSSIHQLGAKGFDNYWGAGNTQADLIDKVRELLDE